LLSHAKNLPSPNRKLILSPVDQILKLNLVANEEIEEEEEKIIIKFRR
jgi:hypothetical protein